MKHPERGGGRKGGNALIVMNNEVWHNTRTNSSSVCNALFSP